MFHSKRFCWKCISGAILWDSHNAETQYECVQANSNDRKQLSTVCLEADKKEMNGDILMLLIITKLNSNYIQLHGCSWIKFRLEERIGLL
jgi:hypothetical protein